MDPSDFAADTAAVARPPAVQPSPPCPDELIVRIGRDIAARLTRALERIDAIAATGRIERGRLQALRDEAAAARRVALRAQQVERIVSTAPERRPARHHLPQALREALTQRRREVESLGLDVRSRGRLARVWTAASTTCRRTSGSPTTPSGRPPRSIRSSGDCWCA